MKKTSDREYCIRDVQKDDLPALVALEEASFTCDRLSRRSFQRWTKGGEGRLFRVLIHQGILRGYGLVLLHQGTHLARLYSICLDPSTRGKGWGKALLSDLETHAETSGRFYMRLEVAKTNLAAISLYKNMGYRIFGEISHYYEDDADALRMQKRIRYLERDHLEANIPWYQQTTPFTCGPASLMMAMASLERGMALTQFLELDLWREATTIYMTSGHGGCHPLGLALAAKRRGFKVQILMSALSPPFIEGVRAEHKKEIMGAVHTHFLEQCSLENIKITCRNVSVAHIEKWLSQGCSVLVLISSYRINGDKAPHWVVVTGADDLCIYVHDPDTEKITENMVDCQHIPIAKKDFSQMASYGSTRFSTALGLSLPRGYSVMAESSEARITGIE
ncbi:GNAT family N-acetyltransferase/peptidase C39 family protein [Kiritimatiellaeota bacterium B1221]|nr:GNAT family N-acetyltransferase/peptidase C39 family protein [Kiritimatiellaeota bacterium B1221]